MTVLWVCFVHLVFRLLRFRRNAECQKKNMKVQPVQLVRNGVNEKPFIFKRCMASGSEN